MLEEPTFEDMIEKWVEDKMFNASSAAGMMSWPKERLAKSATMDLNAGMTVTVRTLSNALEVVRRNKNWDLKRYPFS